VPKEVAQHDHLPDSRARLTMKDVEVEDYHDVVNAFKDGPSEEAEVSFEVSWARGGTLVNLCDETNTFEGTVRETTATVHWTGQTHERRWRGRASRRAIDAASISTPAGLAGSSSRWSSGETDAQARFWRISRPQRRPCIGRSRASRTRAWSGSR
jgi:hypothetical protein